MELSLWYFLLMLFIILLFTNLPSNHILILLFDFEIDTLNILPF